MNNRIHGISLPLKKIGGAGCGKPVGKWPQVIGYRSSVGLRLGSFEGKARFDRWGSRGWRKRGGGRNDRSMAGIRR